MKKISRPAEQAATSAAPFQAYKHHFRDTETGPAAAVADRDTNEPVTASDPADVPLSSAALQGSIGATDGVTGGDDPVRPDKVLDYFEVGLAYSFKRSDLKDQSYYGKLLDKYMFVSYNERFKLNKEEKDGVYQTVWESCPKEKGKPFIAAGSTTTFSIRVNEVDIFGTVEYAINGPDNRQHASINVLYVSDPSVPGRSGGIMNDPGKQKASSGSFFNQITDPGANQMDFTFPASGQTNKQQEFMNANPRIKTGIYNGLMKIYKESQNDYQLERDKLNALANKKDKTKEENDQLQVLKEEINKTIYFSQMMNIQGYNFLLEGNFTIDEQQISPGYLQIGIMNNALPVNPGGKGKTAADAEIELLNQEENAENLNVIGTEDIQDETEKYAVQKFVLYLFGLRTKYPNIKDSTHFDHSLVIDKEKIAYSFTVEQSKQVDAGDGKTFSQRNIFVKRLGKIGVDIADPDNLRIDDIYGYSEQFTKEELISFVTKRYPETIKRENIDGATKESVIATVNELIARGAQTTEWYKKNYSIEIMQNMVDLKVHLKALGFYTGGDEKNRQLTTVKGRTENNAGTVTDEAPTAKDANVAPEMKVTQILDETENVKPWLPSEMKYIELSMQKMSPALVAFYKSKAFKMFRQDYNLSKKYYNQVAGMTYGKNTIGIFDRALESQRIIGSELDLSPGQTSTITHEMGHILQGFQNHQTSKFFNEFYKEMKVNGPTEYSRSLKLSSPDEEFFPEAFDLFLHDPEFMHTNFPEIYMWFLYITEGKQTSTGATLILPTLAESKALVKRRKDFIDKNGREPSMEETRKIVRP